MPGPGRLVAFLGLSLLSAALGGGFADAAETVHVALAEKSDGGMVMETSTERVKAGMVTFDATNKSNDIEHEFLIAPLNGPLEKVPYDDTKGKIIEKALKGVHELGDLNPGKSGTMTLNLKPGKYLLFCNKPGHFKAGMYHLLTVTP